MQINILIRTFLLLSLTVVGLSDVVLGQVQFQLRKPNAEASVARRQMVNFFIKAKGNSGRSIQEATFTFQSPDGDVSEISRRKRGKRKYQVKKRLGDIGTWQWMVTITTTSGESQELDWRAITVVDNSPAPSSPTDDVPTAAPAASTANPTQPTPTSEIPIETVTDDIRLLLSSDETLGAKFVRLGFHMCVGGSCDGCVSIIIQCIDNFETLLLGLFVIAFISLIG